MAERAWQSACTPQRVHPIVTSTELDAEGRGYPRPQLRRAHWYSLNGIWEFAHDRERAWTLPSQVVWSRRIRVPFAPETPASGIAEPDYTASCWYRRQCALPVHDTDGRWLLHFGAVDYHATVWVDGVCAGEHEGGYTPFTLDISDLAPGGAFDLVVRAEDDPLDLCKPRGKQDWKPRPHSIWYPRTTGIWQTVWLERVPVTRIGRVAFTPDLSHWQIGVEVWLDGTPRDPLRLNVKLHSGGAVLAADTYQVISGEVHRGIALSDPGIDDSRNELLWTPDTPTLIDIDLELWGDRGELIDVVRSYAALRTVAAQGERFLLNGRPYMMRMVLDQGYWPDGGLTAPDDAALRRDVTLARRMGFNGVRKHQKIEDPRFLYWADRIGLAVWEEMPSAYRFTQRSVHRLSREWAAAVQRDYSHPCIFSWVPINESWGVPNLPNIARERHYVQALYHLTKTLDPTRPVIGNDGWESVATDIVGIHDYDDQPERMAARYHADDLAPRLFKRERPAGRLLVLEDGGHANLPIMLTEFGGIALAADDHTWGYSRSASSEDFASRYERLLAVVRNLSLLSGFCYTQFADTYQEANGLLRADRTPKFPLERIATATAGPAAARPGGLAQLQDATADGRRE
jgi:beta-galactosidase/beta-glucuronidase